ncbi:hypothetical protein ES703_72597 [subsurface metagenome]
MINPDIHGLIPSDVAEPAAELDWTMMLANISIMKRKAKTLAIKGDLSPFFR